MHHLLSQRMLHCAINSDDVYPRKRCKYATNTGQVGRHAPSSVRGVYELVKNCPLFIDCISKNTLVPRQYSAILSGTEQNKGLRLRISGLRCCVHEAVLPSHKRCQISNECHHLSMKEFHDT